MKTTIIAVAAHGSGAEKRGSVVSVGAIAASRCKKGLLMDSDSPAYRARHFKERADSEPCTHFNNISANV